MDLDAGDPRHGTTRGFYAGCRERCCREAINAYERRRRQVLAIYGTSGVFCSPLGTVRRIEALFALGWFATEIANECGFWGANAILQFKGHKKIRVSNARLVAKVYDKLSARTPPPHPMRQRQKRHAAKKGWAPPLAWDDIDNPDEVPKGVRYYTRDVA